MEQPKTISSRIAALHELLRNCDVKTIVLIGESGIGKSWMAREISNWAIREGLFDLTLWVYLDRAHGERPVCDMNALQESIAHQVSPRPSSEEWEVDDEIEEPQEDSSQEKVTSGGVREKKYLVIVDVADGAEMSDAVIVSKFSSIPELKVSSSYKLLITRRETVSADTLGDATRVIKFLPLTKTESFSLLQEMVGRRDFGNIEKLAKDLIRKKKRLPIELVLLAKALNCSKDDDSRVQVLKNALEEASEEKSYDIAQLLSSGYSLLPSKVLIDLCLKDKEIFRDHGRMHCNELIAYWMLEGYLGRIDLIEKAYDEGHRVLMELIDCNLLKSLDGGNVCVDEENLDLLVDLCGLKQEGKDTSLGYIHRLGYFGTANLGLATLSESKWKGSGRISHTQGMISTIRSPKHGQKLSTLLLDGNLFSITLLQNMLQSSETLQVLFLSNFEEKKPKDSLLETLSSEENLSMLLIRDCTFLDSVVLKVKLRPSLVVLEISGCILKSVPENLFNEMTSLQSLNLSKLLISSLPESLYNLRNLLWLILRGCSSLTKLESLKHMTKLIALDLSGATSLTTIVDASFLANSQLKMLNLSQTQISIPPFFRGLGSLTHLIISGCENIRRLRGLDPLTRLQVLDLSGAKNFSSFHNLSFGKHDSLYVLDLSGTSIKQLPSSIDDPVHLYLKGCSHLSELSYIETLKSLAVLDVSGTLSLTEIKENFFTNLGNLQNLNLSGTSVKTLPSLSNLCELRKLLLSHCSKLEKLPSLTSFKKLEVLDVSGCTSLDELDDDFVEQMCKLQNLIELNLSGVLALRESRAKFLSNLNHLQILNLSKTRIEGLPPLSDPSCLKQLLLGHCSLLKTVPELVKLSNLEVLDLSGTAITDLPPLDRCSKLRKLFLRDCSGLKEFPDVEILQVLKGTSTERPYGISNLNNIELDLPDMKVDQGVDVSETSYSYLKDHQWRISSFLAEAQSSCRRLSASVSGAQFLHLLKQNPTFWDTEFSQFYFSICPMRRDKLTFGGTCFRLSQFLRFREERMLEIHGFQHCPTGISDILRHVHCLLLVDNKFQNWLADLGACNLKELKGCWFDRCSNMESVFQPEKMEEDDVKLVDSLEVLGISNAIKLWTISSQNVKQQMFQNLESIYLDCCPELSVVFHSSFLPESLRVLHIQFCDKIKTLFLDVSLPKLEMLHLSELSMLKSIEGTFPSLKTLSVRYCGDLVTMFKPSPGTNYILTGVKTLQLQELPKLVMKIGDTFPSAENAIVTGCPKLQLPEVTG